jgi:hypothetical protein
VQTGAGVQKGIKTVLIERGLWPTDQQLKLKCSQCKTVNNSNVMNNNVVNCCASRLLNIQPDFSATKEWLQETVVDQNHQSS